MEDADRIDGEVEERTFWSVDGELRAFWKLSAYFAVWVFAAFFVLLATIPLPLPMHLPLVQVSILFAGAVAATLFGMRVLDRSPLRDVGFARPHALRQFWIGAGVSVAMICTVGLAELALGLASMQLNALSFTHAFGLVASGLLLYVVVGISEELLMRGYPFRTLERAASPLVALSVTSVLFSLIHVRNPGIDLPSLCNICLAGIWLGRARIVSGQLWLPIGLHTGWNFAQGTIFGYPVSGMLDETVLRTSVQAPTWFTGGNFGPEGGVLVTVVLILGTLLLSQPRILLWLKAPAAEADADRAFTVAGDAPAAPPADPEGVAE
jgi:membrane protease YdiL (CAAX protease family)